VHEKRRDHARGYCKVVAFGTAGNLKAHISAIHLKIKRSRGAKYARWSDDTISEGECIDPRGLGTQLV